MHDRIIIQIGDKLVSPEIITEYFMCDYDKCGGCCCVIGDSGAPLEENENLLLQEEYDNYKSIMSRAGRETIEKQGFSIIDLDGDEVTPLINGKECAYTVFNKNGDCFCAVERAYCNGLCKFKKPISCRLYPIRVTKLSNGMTALNLHRWNLCDCAFKKGRKEKVPVYKFLREPLIDAFGEEFYSGLESAADASSNNLFASA